MSAYTKVLFEVSGTQRGILCKGPRGSSGLVALHNMAVIFYTSKPGTLGPVNEQELKRLLRLMLQEALATRAIEDSDLFRVIDEHQGRLGVCPILDSPQSFAVSDSVWLFVSMGIRLLHGWVLDPEVSIYQSIKGHTRDQLLLHRASLERQEDDQTENLALVQQLLNAADSQLTDYGFKSLFTEIAEGEFAVVFCYNRFNVVHMHAGKLFMLETDVVVRHKFPEAVWRFFDGELPEDNILLTGEYVPVTGQQKFDEKVAKWTQENSTDETDGLKENQPRGQRRKAQRKKKNAKEGAKASSHVASCAHHKSQGTMEPAAVTKE